MNKKISKILMTITTFFMMTQNVFGNTRPAVFLTDMKSDGQQIYRNYNGQSEKQFSIKIIDEDENELVGYCIDVGETLGDQAYIGKKNVDLKGYLTEMFRNSNIDNYTEKAKQVTKKINQYTHFGYNYNGQTSDKYLIATQKLIWDVLYEAGYRQDSYASDVTFTAGNSRYDISTEEQTIKNNITNYDKKPSLCSSTTNLELAVGETATYEDTSNVLSSYTVNCDEGLTCEKDGNKLTITANSEASEQNVTFTKSGIEGGNTLIYQRTNTSTGELEQAVLVGNDPIEGVSCQLGVDTYQNVQTSETKIIVTFTLAIISVITAYAILLKKQKLNA